MNKSKLLLIALSLFLVRQFTLYASTELRTFPINPAKKVSPTEINIKEIFAREFNILAFARGMYYLDVEARLSKEAIKKYLADDFAKCATNLELSFDLDSIDFRRKGFTRYYPFTVNGKDFIIRIFDINEKHYLPDFEVFYEGVFENSGLGFQIISGIKTILADEKIKKVSFVDPALCANSP